MGMVAILFSGVDPFNRRLHVKSGEYWSNSFREKDVQTLHDFKHVILPTGKGQKTSSGQNFDCNEKVLLL